MPSSFFAFQQGSDTRSLPPPDAESLRYGRFRAFSPRHMGSVGNLFTLFTGSEQQYQTSYGSIDFATGHEVASGDDDEVDETPDDRWWLDRKLVSPRRSEVNKMVGTWWRRWAVLVMLPALLVCESLFFLPFGLFSLTFFLPVCCSACGICRM